MTEGTPGGVDREIPSSLNTLYREVILDHYRRPRNRGELDGATHSVTLNNPLCGDVIELALKVDGDEITDARFQGRGCSISQASVSMLTGRIIGKTLDEALDISARFTQLLHGDESLLEDDELGDLRLLAGVSKFPVRVKCALLGWNCLEDAADTSKTDAAGAPKTDVAGAARADSAGSTADAAPAGSPAE